jgi:hypothetical protein
MIRKGIYFAVWMAIGGACLSVQGCAQLGVQSVCQQALLGTAVGVVVAGQCLEQGVNVLMNTAVYTVGGFRRPYQQTPSLDELDRFKCPNNGKVVLTLTRSDGTLCEVTLMKQGETYAGPQGEHYSGVPSDEQIRSRYGSLLSGKSAGTQRPWDH